MTIKDAAKELKVEAHVLRYWEEELGLDIKRNDMGHRAYSDKDIRMFQRIMELKEKGLSLKDIRDGISAHKGQECSEQDDKRDEKQDDMRDDKQDDKQDGKENVRQDVTHNGKNDEKYNEDNDEKNDKRHDELKVVDFKTAQLQSVMNRLVANALKENKSIITSSLRAEITEDVMKQIDVIVNEKEEREEERFRKLDETLRKLQQSNEEVAATRMKGRLFRKRRK